MILPLKCGFGIGYGIGRKYRPIWVSVSVSDLDQNSGFGRTLIAGSWHLYPESTVTTKSSANVNVNTIAILQSFLGFLKILKD